MALYRYFKTADSVLPAPTGSLSTSISPAAIKDANEAVKSAVTPRSKSVYHVSQIFFDTS